MAETSWNGDCAQVEMSCGKRLNEGGRVGPAHREVAGEDLAGALVELSFNESNKGGWHVLLHHCQCSKAGVYLLCGFKDRC